MSQSARVVGNLRCANDNQRYSIQLTVLVNLICLVISFGNEVNVQQPTTTTMFTTFFGEELCS